MDQSLYTAGKEYTCYVVFVWCLFLIYSYSDGVGRSGAFCALMVSVSQFRTEKIVDVFRTIQIMRGQRPGIVGNSVRDNYVHHIPYSVNVQWRKIWQISIRNFWRVIPICLLSLFMAQNIAKIWMVKFGKPPVICQGFPLPKICNMQYIALCSM